MPDFCFLSYPKYTRDLAKHGIENFRGNPVSDMEMGPHSKSITILVTAHLAKLNKGHICSTLSLDFIQLLFYIEYCHY